VQLESHATPPQASPQQRHAALRRAVERGLDSDELWNDLAVVCLELGFDDEASRCVRRLRNPTLRLALESRLERRGTTSTHPGQKAATSRKSVPAAPHAKAPAASDAGPRDGVGPPPVSRRDRFEIAGLREHLVDAVQFLFQQHLPWLALLTTLAFPIVVGVGGFLTAGGSPLLLAAIAALPGLCVLAVVGAMGRRILVSSSQGDADVPPLGELGPLLGDARRFLCDAGLVLGSLLGPSIIALALDAPLTSSLPGLIVGLFFAPLAWGLRQVRRDLGALSPVTLLRGVARCGLGYVGLVILCVTLFLPAGLTIWAVFGRAVWVQIAAIGPLCVLPLFVVSRLLGTWLDSMRLELGAVLLGPLAREVRDARTLVSEPVADATKPRVPRRPEALTHFKAPSAKARQGQQKPKPVAAATGVVKRTATASSTGPANVAKALAKKAPAAAPSTSRTPVPTAPAAAASTAPGLGQEPRSIEGRSPRRPQLTDTPDLSKMPGATTISGEDRVRQGAAARPR